MKMLVSLLLGNGFCGWNGMNRFDASFSPQRRGPKRRVQSHKTTWGEGTQLKIFLRRKSVLKFVAISFFLFLSLLLLHSILPSPTTTPTSHSHSKWPTLLLSRTSSLPSPSSPPAPRLSPWPSPSPRSASSADLVSVASSTSCARRLNSPTLTFLASSTALVSFECFHQVNCHFLLLLSNAPLLFLVLENSKRQNNVHNDPNSRFCGALGSIEGRGKRRSSYDLQKD